MLYTLYFAATIGCMAPWFLLATRGRTTSDLVPGFFFGVIVPVWFANAIAARRVYRRVKGTAEGFMTRWGWWRHFPAWSPLGQAFEKLGPKASTLACLAGALPTAILGGVVVASV